MAGKPTPWTDAENDLAVASYFEMLRDDLSRLSYNKTASRRSLLALIDRGESSIEFKHQNISAILKGMGQPWIDGYKPASNYQRTLRDAVLRWFAIHSDWQPHELGRQSTAFRIRADRELWIGPPPTHSNAEPPADLARLQETALICNVAERDARNRSLGLAGELRILEHERSTLQAAGRRDLASQVRHLAVEEGDGFGYDIASFEPNGNRRLIEVKTTNGWERTPFHISRNELAVADDARDEWHLVRLWNFAREPKAFALRPPLQAHVALTPTSFLAALH